MVGLLDVSELSYDGMISCASGYSPRPHRRQPLPRKAAAPFIDMNKVLKMIMLLR
jgi:hypothetical protein